jgi:hypothetical protein
MLGRNRMRDLMRGDKIMATPAPFYEVGKYPRSFAALGVQGVDDTGMIQQEKALRDIFNRPMMGSGGIGGFFPQNNSFARFPSFVNRAQGNFFPQRRMMAPNYQYNQYIRNVGPTMGNPFFSQQQVPASSKPFDPRELSILRVTGATPKSYTSSSLQQYPNTQNLGMGISGMFPNRFNTTRFGNFFSQPPPNFFSQPPPNRFNTTGNFFSQPPYAASPNFFSGQRMGGGRMAAPGTNYSSHSASTFTPTNAYGPGIANMATGQVPPNTFIADAGQPIMEGMPQGIADAGQPMMMAEGSPKVTMIDPPPPVRAPQGSDGNLYDAQGNIMGAYRGAGTGNAGAGTGGGVF